MSASIPEVRSECIEIVVHGVVTRRLALRVAYFPPDQVRISGETTAYVWGDRMIGIHHCPTCGCGTHWQSLGQDFGKMGVNARLLDGFDEGVEVRKITTRANRAQREYPLPALPSPSGCPLPGRRSAHAEIA